MEYNVSARHPNNALKKRAVDAAIRADDLLKSSISQTRDDRSLCEIIKEYLRLRYLLEPKDMDETEYLNHLGETSIARGLGIPVEAVRKNELDSKCTGTSSSMAKKILLVIAINKALSIAIDAETTANMTTVTELCDAVRAQLVPQIRAEEHGNGCQTTHDR